MRRAIGKLSAALVLAVMMVPLARIVHGPLA